MIPEREREALMRLTMCAREECGMCKYKDTCDFDFQYETATRCMNILADALRKLNSSEIPNNCDEPQLTPNYCGTCKHREVPCGDLPCDVCHGYSHFEPKDEPTISKMEQVEDEPTTQTETQNSNLTFEKRTMRDCYNCERYETEGECVECHYEPKDECAKEYEELGPKELKELIKADRKTEPQTCSVNGRPYDCGNCEYFKCTADEPQAYKPTCNGECRNCDYRAKDGNYCMKTDCSWK